MGVTDFKLELMSRFNYEFVLLLILSGFWL